MKQIKEISSSMQVLTAVMLLLGIGTSILNAEIVQKLVYINQVMSMYIMIPMHTKAISVVLIMQASFQILPIGKIIAVYYMVQDMT